MDIKLPYEIVENSNSSDNKVTVTMANVKGYIIDKEGIHLAEEINRGWSKIVDTHKLTIKGKRGGYEIFKSFKKAMDFTDEIDK